MRIKSRIVEAVCAWLSCGLLLQAMACARNQVGAVQPRARSMSSMFGAVGTSGRAPQAAEAQACRRFVAATYFFRGAHGDDVAKVLAKANRARIGGESLLLAHTVRDHALRSPRRPLLSRQLDNARGETQSPTTNARRAWCLLRPVHQTVALKIREHLGVADLPPSLARMILQ